MSVQLDLKNTNEQLNKIQNQLKNDTTKTIIENKNIISINDNIGGIANIMLEGNTLENLIPNSEINETSNAYGFGFRKTKTILEAGKTYTLILNGKINQQALDTQKQLACFIHTIGWGGFSESIIIDSTVDTTKVKKFTPNKTEQLELDFYLYPRDGNRNGKVTANWIMLLEGDWTNKQIPSYFNGIRSVGELKDNQIEIKSTGKNLFDINKKPNYTQSSIYTIKNNSITITSDKTTNSAIVRYCFDLKPNTKYFFSAKSSRTGATGGDIYISNRYGKLLYDNNLNPHNTFATLEDGYVYIYLYGESGSSNGTSATYWDIQLEEGDKATEYEDYKEDKILCTLKEPLRGLPNGVRDIINTDGILTRQIGKIVLDEKTAWNNALLPPNTLLNNVCVFSTKLSFNFKNNYPMILNDLFKRDVSWKDEEHIFMQNYNNNKEFYIFIDKTKIATPDINGFKKWLKDNPTIVYYELAEPTIENTGQQLSLQTFKNGNIQVNTNIIPYLTIKYPTNISSRITTIEKASSLMKDNLGGAWRTLLVLADNDLKIRSETLPKMNSQYEVLTNFNKDISAREFSTYNTNGNNTNKWQKVGHIILEAQYDDCIAIFDILGCNNGCITPMYSKLLFRVKQQAGMEELPYVSLQLLESTKLDIKNFKAVITNNTKKETKVELWLFDDMSYNIAKFKINANSDNSFKFERSNFVEKLPEGKIIECELGGNAKKINSIEKILINKGYM